MSSAELVTLRYPSGVTEYRLRETPPVIGDVLVSEGRRWVVKHVSQAADGTVTVILRADLQVIDGQPDGSSSRNDMLAALHQRAAALHEEAAKLHAEHADEMTAKNEPAKAARAVQLATKERQLADLHHALARQRPETQGTSRLGE